MDAPCAALALSLPGAAHVRTQRDANDYANRNANAYADRDIVYRHTYGRADCDANPNPHRHEGQLARRFITGGVGSGRGFVLRVVVFFHLELSGPSILQMCRI